jgi:hypothetical protein
MDAAELLDTPLLIHKSVLPGGVVDLVERYDAAAGDTFFGEAKPRQDYRQYRQKCAEREEGFKPTVENIVNELIAEASTITSRPMAADRLHKISEKHTVKLAGQDKTINPEVFGISAAAHIEMARWHNEMGNGQQASAELEVAVQKAESYSCPSGKGTSSDKQEGSDESGDCEFVSKECPECHKKNVKTSVKKISGTRKQISGNCGCSITVKV